MRISSSEVIVFERFLVESIGFDAASKSSSELVKFCGVKMRLWKPEAFFEESVECQMSEESEELDRF